MWQATTKNHSTYPDGKKALLPEKQRDQTPQDDVGVRPNRAARSPQVQQQPFEHPGQSEEDAGPDRFFRVAFHETDARNSAADRLGLLHAVGSDRTTS